MKKLSIVFILALFGRVCFGQVPVGNPSVLWVTSAPSGACTNGSQLQAVISTGTLYSCQSSTWAAIAGGGGSVSLTSPNSTLSFSPSPITGTGTLDINLANANTWTALQTFGTHISIGGVTAAGATGTGNSVFATAPTITGATLTTSSVNGVTPTTGGSATTFLNGAGAYTTPSGGGVTSVYNTTLSATAASIASTTMVTPGANTTYTFAIGMTQTTATAGCSAQPSLSITLGYTDALNNKAETITFIGAYDGGQSISPTNIGLSSSTFSWSNFPWHFQAKSGVPVTILTTYGAGTGCSNGGAYSITPTLTSGW